MKIFLTGATGFLGLHVLRKCLSRGHKVIACTRNDIANLNVHNHKNLHWIQSNLDHVPTEALNSCDVLVHLAAHSVLYPFDSSSNCINENVLRPLTLFEKARLAGINRFIIAGSCFEYGSTGEKCEAISSTSPLNPTNSYAVSKSTATLAFTQWANENNLSLEVLRIFHLFGEGEAKTRFWPSLRFAALSGDDYNMTGGEQIRDFMEVGNVAEVFINRAEIHPDQCPGPNIYNLSSNNAQSLKKFAEYWWNKWEATGKLKFGAVPYRLNEVMRFVPGPDMLVVKSFYNS